MEIKIADPEHFHDNISNAICLFHSCCCTCSDNECYIPRDMLWSATIYFNIVKGLKTNSSDFCPY